MGVASSSTDFLGPQWAAKVEVEPPTLSQTRRVAAYQMADPITRHGADLGQEQVLSRTTSTLA
jgi:hypothetical protein